MKSSSCSAGTGRARINHPRLAGSLCNHELSVTRENAGVRTFRRHRPRRSAREALGIMAHGVAGFVGPEENAVAVWKEIAEQPVVLDIAALQTQSFSRAGGINDDLRRRRDHRQRMFPVA